MKRFYLIIVIIISISDYSFSQNSADVYTFGYNDKTSVIQIGSNKATIDMNSVDFSSASQIQNGNGNIVQIEQTTYFWKTGGNSDHNIAAQKQLGNNNYARIMQNPDPDLGNNMINQYQNGNLNKLNASQFTVNSQIVQNQTGIKNDALSYQVGFNGYIKQDQTGNENIAIVDEQGGGGRIEGNIALQTQNGDRNKSEISQYGSGGIKSAQGNKAYIIQEGNDNWAGEGFFSNGLFGIYQQGNNNTTTVYQKNNSNKSQVLQYGNENEVHVIQNGTACSNSSGDYVNKSSVTQSGNNNSCTVNQTYNN